MAASSKGAAARREGCLWRRWLCQPRCWRLRRRASHTIKLLSRRFLHDTEIIPKYHTKKRNKSDIRLDKNRHRRSSATHHVASSSFPSNVIVDSQTPSGKLRNIVMNEMDYRANTEKSDIVSRDNTSMIPTRINSMRIIRRDTNSLEIRTTTQTNLTWPVKRTAIIPGEIVIGGLHMVHERENQRICGPVMPQGGLQAAEAAERQTTHKENRRRYWPSCFSQQCP